MLLIFDNRVAFRRFLSFTPQEYRKLGYGVTRCSIKLLLANNAKSLSEDGEEGEKGRKEKDEKEEVEQGPLLT